MLNDLLAHQSPVVGKGYMKFYCYCKALEVWHAGTGVQKSHFRGIISMYHNLDQ